MDNYKVLCLVGEGSFGRVFKAKIRDTKDIVALKIIRKCGRTQKELLSLQSECKIQKHLHHRNIIQMINSFETENEIVVVTEFCKRDLHYILSKQNYLTEEKALPIVCDLVSALYYLHSNRVLHRDLKPQNVLIAKDGVAKLCDFGFARSMSRGTHVLTSIKGTPLYMAPELMEENPYDHNADLWSLGCIIYEMVVGMPPFTTNSILQLVRMIRHEPVAWPTYLSEWCQDLLQGLLRKDPVERLTWPYLLEHPFLQDKVSSSIASGVSLPLTKELTASQALAKESQKKDLASNKEDTHAQGLPQNIQQILEHEKSLLLEEGDEAIELNVLEQKWNGLKLDSDVKTDSDTSLAATPTHEYGTSECEEGTTDEESLRALTPLETEEWLAFLQQSVREVMSGDIESISDKSFVTMVMNALTNHGATAKVSEFIACLLAFPFVAPDVSKSELATITSVYMDLKIVSSLMFAIKLLTQRTSCSGSHDSMIEASKLSTDQLIAIGRVLVLVNQLVHYDQKFLSQLCDVVVLLHLAPRLHLLLTLHRTQPRIVTDLVAILSHILRQMPENASIIDETVDVALKGLNWEKLVKYGSSCVQTRVCQLIQLMAQHCPDSLQALWTPELHHILQLLAYHSCQTIRSAAEDALENVQDMPFSNPNPNNDEESVSLI